MRLMFWLKAFIPDSLHNTAGEELTWRARVLGLSPDKSDTSLLPLLTLFPFLFASYATDQRSFSPEEKASARITTRIETADDPRSEVSFQRYSDPTHQLSGLLSEWLYSTDEYLESKTSQPKGKQSIERTRNSIHIAFSTSGVNPFFQTCKISYAPSITMEFDLNIDFSDPTQLQVVLRGRVSQFPAFEAYLKVDDQDPVCLFRHSPPAGNTPFNLLYGWTKINAKSSLATAPAAKPKPPLQEATKVAQDEKREDHHLAPGKVA